MSSLIFPQIYNRNVFIFIKRIALGLHAYVSFCDRNNIRCFDQKKFRLTKQDFRKFYLSSDFKNPNLKILSKDFRSLKTELTRDYELIDEYLANDTIDDNMYNITKAKQKIIDRHISIINYLLEQINLFYNTFNQKKMAYKKYCEEREELRKYE